MKNKKEIFIRSASLAGFLACIGDMTMTALYGYLYPGYNQFQDSMSKLGATKSPVGFQMSLWWVILCFILGIFAFGFKMRYYKRSKRFRIAFWLIITYALGEGMGSGIFPADHLKDTIGLSLMIHDLLGGIGIAGIIILPHVLLKPLSNQYGKRFKKFSWGILVFGPAMLILFSLAKIINNPDNFIVLNRGLWQRLLMLNYYLYLMVIALIMWMDSADMKK